jgi:hypothetical protein
MFGLEAFLSNLILILFKTPEISKLDMFTKVISFAWERSFQKAIKRTFDSSDIGSIVAHSSTIIFNRKFSFKEKIAEIFRVSILKAFYSKSLERRVFGYVV